VNSSEWSIDRGLRLSAAHRSLTNVIPSTRENRLLAALPGDEHERLLNELERVHLNLDDAIYEYGEQIRYVYFPQGAVVSMLAILEDGTTLEVGMVGNDGMVGISVILGANRARNLTVVEIPGEAVRMKVSSLKEWQERSEVLNQLLMRSYRSLITQFCQRAACNCRHMVLHRLCTWLLMAEDCLGRADLPVTQDLISRRLGSRRASVTGAYNYLQKIGLVRYSRGHVTLLDRPQLEALACECYQIIKDESPAISIV
jgi:CRP-like cAMP-binding protein